MASGNLVTAIGVLPPTATLWAKFQRQRFGDKAEESIQKLHKVGITAFHTEIVM